MPQIIGNNCVVTLNELVPELIPSYDALRMQLDRAKKRGFGISRFKRGGGKDGLLLIDYDTLPPRYQARILDPRKVKHPLVPFYSITHEVRCYFQNYLYPDGVHLPQDAIEKYIINASVLSSLVLLEQARIDERVKLGNNSSKGIFKSLFKDSQSFNDYLFAKYEYRHSLNSNERSFRRQFDRFKNANDPFYTIIVDPEGKRRKNALKRDDKTNELLDALFAGQDFKPTMKQVADQYNAFLAGYIDVFSKNTGEQYEPTGYKSLDKRTVQKFLATWDSSIGTHAKRSGDRQKLINDKLPYHSMQTVQFAGSVISIDDRQPPFEYAKGKRMWWYLGIDVASEAIVAWAYGKTKEELIKNFYKNLVANFANWGLNLPAQLECESSLNSSFRNTFLQEGAMFEHVKIHANNARSKIVERFFGELRYRMEKEHEGWLARPFAKSETNQASAVKKTIIPYQKLVEQSFNDIMTWNNMAHSKDETISRFDYFLKNQHPKIKPTNYQSFIKYLGKQTETSCKAGIVKLQKSEWLLGDKGTIYTGDKLIKLLRQANEKDLRVFWLDDEEGNIYKAMVYDYNSGRYICEILPKPQSSRAKIEETAAHREARELMSRYEQTVQQYMRTKRKAIDDVLVIDERPKTISNSFTIGGFKKFVPRTTPAENLGEDYEDEYSYTPKEHQAQGLDRAFNN